MRRSRLSLDLLPHWIETNGVKLNGVGIAESDNGHGSGIVANTMITSAKHQFVVVPPELILNVGRIWAMSVNDPHLRELLEANGDYAKVRVNFVTTLLHQMHYKEWSLFYSFF